MRLRRSRRRPHRHRPLEAPPDSDSVRITRSLAPGRGCLRPESSARTHRAVSANTSSCRRAAPSFVGGWRISRRDAPGRLGMAAEPRDSRVRCDARQHDLAVSVALQMPAGRSASGLLNFFSGRPRPHAVEGAWCALYTNERASWQVRLPDSSRGRYCNALGQGGCARRTSWLGSRTQVARADRNPKVATAAPR